MLLYSGLLTQGADFHFFREAKQSCKNHLIPMKVSGIIVHVCCSTFLHYRPSLPQQQMDQCSSSQFL